MRFFIIIIFLLLNLSACTTINIDNKSNIYGRWQFEKIIYDETSSTIFEKGEFIEIQKEYIIRGSKEPEIHRYNYVRTQNIFNLALGNKFITWKIILFNKHALHFKADFGLLILKR